MLIFSLLFLLLSNAVTLRRDKSILFNRLTIKILSYYAFLDLSGAYLVFYTEIRVYKLQLLLINTLFFHFFLCLTFFV